jgi:hypothetical protein
LDRHTPAQNGRTQTQLNLDHATAGLLDLMAHRLGVSRAVLIRTFIAQGVVRVFAGTADTVTPMPTVTSGGKVWGTPRPDALERAYRVLKEQGMLGFVNRELSRIREVGTGNNEAVVHAPVPLPMRPTIPAFEPFHTPQSTKSALDYANEFREQSARRRAASKAEQQERNRETNARLTALKRRTFPVDEG